MSRKQKTAIASVLVVAAALTITFFATRKPTTDVSEMKVDLALVDPERSNFRLSPESPCIGKGAPISGLPGIERDYYGQQRDPNTPCIGPIEFVPLVERPGKPGKPGKPWWKP